MLAPLQGSGSGYAMTRDAPGLAEIVREGQAFDLHAS